MIKFHVKKIFHGPLHLKERLHVYIFPRYIDSYWYVYRVEILEVDYLKLWVLMEVDYSHLEYQ